LYRREIVIKFIVFGHARTGTTVLLDLLQSHPEIQAFGEVFHQKSRE